MTARRRTDVVALYVDPKGPYPQLVEDWRGKDRDARLYDGPFPVVAHPPCGPWSSLRHLYLGDEHDCAERALEQVRRWGGILEHPAGSLLWSRDGDSANPKRRGSQYMARPGEFPDAWGGLTFEVRQCDWGHPANKRTWIYVIGTEYPSFPSRREATHWCSGTHAPGQRGTVPEGIKVCSAEQRRRTPVAFAEWLLALAATSRVDGNRIARALA